MLWGDVFHAESIRSDPRFLPQQRKGFARGNAGSALNETAPGNRAASGRGQEQQGGRGNPEYDAEDGGNAPRSYYEAHGISFCRGPSAVRLEKRDYRGVGSQINETEWDTWGHRPPPYATWNNHILKDLLTYLASM